MQIEKVYEFWNEKLKNIRDSKVVIAGGSVRDHFLGVKPKDYDVFVVNCNKKTELISRIAEIKEASVIERDVLNHFSIHEDLIANLYWEGKIVQIIRSTNTTVDSLLKGFDWNICLFAYDGNFILKEDVEKLQPGNNLILHNFDKPINNLKRGFLFAERYGLKFQKQDIKFLCDLVLKIPEPLEDIKIED